MSIIETSSDVPVLQSRADARAIDDPPDAGVANDKELQRIAVHGFAWSCAAAMCYRYTKLLPGVGRAACCKDANR